MKGELLEKYKDEIERNCKLVGSPEGAFQIQLTDTDAEVIQKYVKDIEPPNCYMEIGGFHGASAMIARDVIRDDINVYSIEILPCFRLKDWEGIIPIQGDSSEIVKAWTRPIGVLFIDGNHEHALLDFNEWERFVVPGGIILFHDYAKHSPTVIKDCEEIVKKWNYEVLFRPVFGESTTGIFQIKKLC